MNTRKPKRPSKAKTWKWCEENPKEALELVAKIINAHAAEHTERIKRQLMAGPAQEWNPPSYQWVSAGLPIPGATGRTYILSSEKITAKAVKRRKP